MNESGMKVRITNALSNAPKGTVAEPPQMSGLPQRIQVDLPANTCKVPTMHNDERDRPYPPAAQPRKDPSAQEPFREKTMRWSTGEGRGSTGELQNVPVPPCLVSTHYASRSGWCCPQQGALCIEGHTVAFFPSKQTRTIRTGIASVPTYFFHTTHINQAVTPCQHGAGHWAMVPALNEDCVCLNGWTGTVLPALQELQQPGRLLLASSGQGQGC